MRHIDDDERRNRLAQRHAVAAPYRLADPAAVARAMTALHATDYSTAHLSVLARADGVTPASLDHELYESRTLVKLLAMRRTLFVVPADLLSATLGSASARVVRQERTRLIKDLIAADISTDPQRWLQEAADAVTTVLMGSGPMTTKQVKDAVPQAAQKIPIAPGTKWESHTPVASRLLTLLSADGAVVRGPHTGSWQNARPTWTLMSSWLGHEVEPATPEAGYAELTRRWLWTFGPGTVDDLKWWLGSTLTAARASLDSVGAVQVQLDGGQTGWVLADDLDPMPAPQPWAALLPILDPTVMGWRDRGFYLGEHGPALFDTVGNAGTTAWWNGRVVGCWVQGHDNTVVVVPLGDLGSEAHQALSREADRLTRLLAGSRAVSLYPSPLMQSARR